MANEYLRQRLFANHADQYGHQYSDHYPHQYDDVYRDRILNGNFDNHIHSVAHGYGYFYQYGDKQLQPHDDQHWLQHGNNIFYPKLYGDKNIYLHVLKHRHADIVPYRDFVVNRVSYGDPNPDQYRNSNRNADINLYLDKNPVSNGNDFTHTYIYATTVHFHADIYRFGYQNGHQYGDPDFDLQFHSHDFSYADIVPCGDQYLD
jgi:hypothetical protein